MTNHAFFKYDALMKNMTLPALFAGTFAKIEDRDAARQLVIDILSENPEALAAFEEAYEKATAENISFRERLPEKPAPGSLSDRIVSELLGQTKYIEWDGKELSRGSFPDPGQIVSREEVENLPEDERPQLTGYMSVRDIRQPSWPAVLDFYRMWMLEKDDMEKKRLCWHKFRQGLDLLDMDQVLYAMLGMNRNSMSNWLPPLVEGIQKQDFFRVPRTRICLVPVDIMQMSRQEYSSLRPATLAIIDQWAYRAFSLRDDGDYFIRTGTYSSKFDFRNARVHDPKEIRELGEYLLYLQNYATTLAGSLHNPVIYGTSTTNEWAVREFIEDAENNPCIYHGMPLRAEYRFFVDLDDDDIIGSTPYWEPRVMKKRLGYEEDADHPDMKHDFVIYSLHEPTLAERYRKNIGKLYVNVRKLLPDISLSGQWSLDIMQNGDDFWIIDMGLAQDSALSECVPRDRRKTIPENWLPLGEESGRFWSTTPA